jgi:hypothetical protein
MSPVSVTTPDAGYPPAGRLRRALPGAGVPARTRATSRVPSDIPAAGSLTAGNFGRSAGSTGFRTASVALRAI